MLFRRVWIGYGRKGDLSPTGLRSVALCAMVVAACLIDASPCRSHGAGDPSVIVDLSAIDEAVQRSRPWPHHVRHRGDLPQPGSLDNAAARPLRPAGVVSPQDFAAPSPAPGTAAYEALFPPPPPVPADAPSSEASRTAADPAPVSPGLLSASTAGAALPVARPVRPVPAGFAGLGSPAPRRPAFAAAAAVVARPAVAPRRDAAAYRAARAIRPELAPPAKPLQRLESDERRPVRLRLPYAVARTDLSPSAQAELEALVREVGSEDRLRLRLAAYANAGAGSPAKARRTSLVRALAVRSFLIDRGIKAGRIDLRALGNTPGAAEADRVDVVVNDK